MRLMGLDVGEKTIGIAVSDPMGLTAQGVTVIRRTSKKQDWNELRRLIHEYEVEALVIGVPRRTDGSYGPEAEAVRRFGNQTAAHLRIKVEYWDERFSTVTAERVLLEGDVSRKKRRPVIDKVAATIILQSYLDYRSRRQEI